MWSWPHRPLKDSDATLLLTPVYQLVIFFFFPPPWWICSALQFPFHSGILSGSCLLSVDKSMQCKGEALRGCARKDCKTNSLLGRSTLIIIFCNCVEPEPWKEVAYSGCQTHIRSWASLLLQGVSLHLLIELSLSPTDITSFVIFWVCHYHVGLVSLSNYFKDTNMSLLYVIRSMWHGIVIGSLCQLCHFWWSDVETEVKKEGQLV